MRRERIAADVVAACVREAEALRRAFPRRVVNGTGVLIHTNLGRAPLGPMIEELDAGALSGYTDLEWDAASQSRGDGAHLVSRLLQRDARLEPRDRIQAVMVLAELESLPAGEEKGREEEWLAWFSDPKNRNIF